MQIKQHMEEEILTTQKKGECKESLQVVPWQKHRGGEGWYQRCH
jgi:hypothetical protein